MLFDYQRDAVNRTQKLLAQLPYRVVLHMPTGSGKTRVAMHIVADHLRTHAPGLVVWLAQTEELCEQAASEFERAWSFLGDRRVSLYRFWGSHQLDPTGLQDGLVVAGLAKLYATAMSNIGAIGALGAHTSLVVLDEAHTAVAPTYKLMMDALLVHRTGARLLGLTATPGRTWADRDADAQLALYFVRRKVTLKVEGYANPVDYLTDEGFLARPAFLPLNYRPGQPLSHVELEQVSRHFDVPESILRHLAQDEQRNLAIVTALEELARRHRRILLFSATADHAALLAAVLRVRGLWANSVTASTPPTTRTRVIEAFKERTDEPRVLVNYGVLTTGFDAPATSAALIARPTKSLVLYSQMVGRALRGVKAGGNASADIVTVVDFTLPGFDSVAGAFTNWEDIWL